MAATTEITLVEGTRFRVQGHAASVERRILDAARGSIMELAWLTEVESGDQVGINPEAVVMIRAAPDVPDAGHALPQPPNSN